MPVAGPNAELIRRLVDLFNREMDEVTGDFSAQWRDLYVDEPVIAPLRTAMEGTEYSGPNALDDFAQAMAESWSHVKAEIKEIRELDADRVLVVAGMTATGRDTGAEITQPIGWLVLVQEGKIAEVRTYTSEREALEAAGR